MKRVVKNLNIEIKKLMKKKKRKKKKKKNQKKLQKITNSIKIKINHMLKKNMSIDQNQMKTVLK